MHDLIDAAGSWTSASFALLALFILTVFLYGWHPVAWWKLRGIPGPRGRWLVGSLPEIVPSGPHEVYTKWGQQYGQIFKYFAGAQPVVVVNDAEMARLVSLRLSTRPQPRSPASLMPPKEAALQRLGLFSTNDKEYHRSMKHAWLPVFNSASLEISSKEMNIGAERLAITLAKFAKEGKEVNIWRQFGYMTMDVVGTAAFGVELRTQEGEKGMNSEEAERLVWAAQTIFATNSVRASIYTAPGAVLPVLDPLLKLLARYFPDTGMTTAIKARHILRDTVRELVKETRQREAAGVSPAASAAAAGPAPSAAEARKKARGVQPGSFLNLMINSKHESSGSTVSDDEATAQAFTFLLAGYETTASALAFTIYTLAKHPDKTEKLVKEVDSIGRQASIGPAELAEMPYLDACLKESMRLYPPGHITPREPLTEDFTVKGYTIPKGTWIHMPIFTLQRSEEYYGRPLEYIPERWIEGTPEEAALNKKVPGSWMAFGEGTRSCVGQRFALQEAKITLARLFQRFTFKLSPGQEDESRLHLQSFFTLGPKEGIFVVPVLRTEE